MVHAEWFEFKNYLFFIIAELPVVFKNAKTKPFFISYIGKYYYEEKNRLKCHEIWEQLSDPYSFCTDLDPVKNLNADPDSNCYWTLTWLKIKYI